MADQFASFTTGKADPGDRHWQIVPDDMADIDPRPRAIYCHEDGTAVIRDEAGVDLPYHMTAGEHIPFRGVRVLATGTTGVFYAWS